MSVHDAIREFPYLFAFFFFWFGACVGSFLNVCVCRIPLGLSIVSPPSHCPRCNAKIRPWENIPIFSWLFLRGKCSRCHAPISPQYVLMEAATGLLWAALFLQTLFSGQPLVFLAISIPLISIAIPCFLIDLRYRILPNEFTFAAMIWGPVFWLAYDLLRRDGGAFRIADSLFLRSLFCVVGVYALFWAFSTLGRKTLGREALGMGDVKLLAGIAGCLGAFSAFCILFLGSAAALLCVPLFRVFRPKRRRRPFPFGPFLTLALAFWLFAGRAAFRVMQRIMQSLAESAW